MSAIVPVSAESVSQESTASTTFVASDTTISGASLGTGIKNLVLYCAGYGVTGFQDAEARVLFGATDIARSRNTGNGGGGSRESLRCYNVSGLMVLTSDGSSALTHEYRVATSGTAYIGGKTIVAIPLTDLVENTDYFDGAQGNSDGVASSATATFVTVQTETFTLPEDGEYLVIACCEATYASPSTDSAAGLRMTVDGGIGRTTYRREIHGGSDRVGWFYHRVHTLSAGSRTFLMEGNRTAGSGTINFHRPRIFVLRLAAFADYVHNLSNSSVSPLALYPTFTAFVSQDFVPSESQTVVVLGSGHLASAGSGNGCGMRVRNTTDGVSHGETVGGHNDNVTTDLWTAASIGAETGVASTKTYQLQGAATPVGTATTLSFGDLLILGMVLAPTSAPEGSVTVGDSATVIGVSASRKSLEVRNVGGFPVYIGDSSVTTEDGMPIPSGGVVRLSPEAANEDIYVIASGAGRVRFLQTY